MTITCNVVKNLKGDKKPPVEYVNCSCTDDKKFNCSGNQQLNQPEPYCGVIQSNKLTDMGSSDPKYLDCAAHNQSYMEAHNNTPYKCTGVRDAVGGSSGRTYSSDDVYKYILDGSGQSSKDIQYESYKGIPSDKNLIKHQDINYVDFKSTTPLDNLVGEYIQRRQHVWYNSQLENYLPQNKNPRVMQETYDLIKAANQKRIATYLAKLKLIIINTKDYKNKSAIQFDTNLLSKGDLVKTDDLRFMEDDTSKSNIDCICYSDCTNFLVMYRRSCSCNINCRCNYS